MTSKDANTSASTVAPGRGRALWALGMTLALGYGLDQVTKMLAVRHLDPANPPQLLGGWLQLKLIRNPGAAFSLGTEITWVFTVLAVLALLGCAIGLAPRLRTVGGGVVLGMAMAGIAGNLTDRLVRPPGPLHGHVVDFFAVPHFAIFNVADVFLTTAAGIVLLWSLGESRREARVASEEA